MEDATIWDELRDWLAERGIRHQDFADSAKIDRALLSRYLNGHRRPSPKHRHAIQQETGGAEGPFSASRPWTLLSERDDAEPQSGERDATAPPAPPRELGSTPDELRASVTAIERDLGVPGLTPPQRTQLHRAKVSALTALSRLEERAGIHEHPDFADLVGDLVDAVLDELGPDAPPGIESRIADRFERKQLERADSRHRKAAA